MFIPLTSSGRRTATNKLNIRAYDANGLETQISVEGSKYHIIVVYSGSEFIVSITEGLFSAPIEWVPISKIPEVFMEVVCSLKAQLEPSLF